MSFADNLKGKAEALGDRASDALETARDKAEGAWDNVTDKAEDVIGAVQDRAGDLIGTVKERIDSGPAPAETTPTETTPTETTPTETTPTETTPTETAPDGVPELVEDFAAAGPEPVPGGYEPPGPEANRMDRSAVLDLSAAESERHSQPGQL